MRVDELRLSVANLDLVLNMRDCNITLTIPTSYEKFLQPVANPQADFNRLTPKNEQQAERRLILQLHNDQFPAHQAGEHIAGTEIWDLGWDKNKRNFLFANPRGIPPCKLRVAQDFTMGDLYGSFDTYLAEGCYPLLGLDNLIYINWLASLKDISLHASAVAIDGKGYAFFGVSGVGKSTLAEALNRNHGVAILAEDQVFLRFRNGRFWIFGTPWHENPDMCSPIGVPLEKLFYLVRSDVDEMVPMPSSKAITQILRTAFIPYYRTELLPGLLDRLVQLAATVPIYMLSYSLGRDIWSQILRS